MINTNGPEASALMVKELGYREQLLARTMGRFYGVIPYTEKMEGTSG